MTLYFPNLTVFFKCFNGTYYRLIIQLSRIFSWDVKVVHNICKVSAKYFYLLGIFLLYLLLPLLPQLSVRFSCVFSEKLSFTVCQKIKFVSRFFYIKIIADVLFNFFQEVLHEHLFIFLQAERLVSVFSSLHLFKGLNLVIMKLHISQP